MTMQKSFKRLVRARMAKTGESYTTARARLLAAEAPKATDGPALPVSDAVLIDRTGQGWEDWLDLLDAWGAADRPRSEVHARLRAERGLDSWSANAVSIGYLAARGLRAVGEKADGRFTVGATRTVAVPVERLFAAFTAAPGEALRLRTALPPRSARYDWEDGASRVVATFVAKDEARSVVNVQHERLPDGAEAERMKAYWRDRVTGLKAELEA